MSLKVLFIGAFKDGTGWGNAAQNYILALDSVGITVVPRAIKLNDRTNAYIPSRILELEENDEQGSDVCIQHVIPDMMEPRGCFDVNVGAFMCETTHFRNTKWSRSLNMMDQVWATNDDMSMAAWRSGVKAPITVVPLCFDVSKYSQPYNPYPIPEPNDKFVFYTIGELIRRKNLTALLRAFHLEFKPREPVSLLIKGHMPGASQMESHRIAKSIIEDIKRGLRLYPNETDYHNEIIITQWLSDEEVMRLHKTGDCFVLPSYGEAWCIPGFEAMAIGNPVILSGEGGPESYIDDEINGLLIDGRYEPVLIRPEEVPLPDIWVGNEDWFSVNINTLRGHMRNVYENKKLRERLSSNGIDKAYEYSHQVVGQKMKNLLEGT